MKKDKKVMINVLIFLSVMISFTGCGIKKDKKDPLLNQKELKNLIYISDTFNDAEAILTIISDDGLYPTAVNLNKIFGKRGLVCTIAGAITIIKPKLDLWKCLLEEGNINIVSHSYNHIRMEDGSEISQDMDSLKHEIVDADVWYENTFGNEQIVFVCPENQMCEMGYEILEENGFWAVRRGHRGYNSLNPAEGTENGDWFNLMVQGVALLAFLGSNSP